MAVADKVKAMLNLKGVKIKDMADYFGMTQQAMRNKLNRDSFSAEDLIKVSMFLDAELSFRISANQVIVLDENDVRETLISSFEVRKLRQLDRRMEEIINDRKIRGEYQKNEHGVMIIPAISDSDKPNNVSPEEWQKYMEWKFHLKHK